MIVFILHVSAWIGVVYWNGTEAIRLSQIWILVGLSLDSQQYGGVPILEPWNAVIVFNGIGESIDILLFKMFAQSLKG